ARDLVIEARAAAMRVLGIGVAVAELVDPEGNVTSANLIAWRGLPVRSRFEELAPCVVEADARAAAAGEARFGAGRPFRQFFYVTVGTGIGSAFFKDGRAHTGARGSAGTVASAPLTFECAACGTTSRPVLEEIASGPALLARYRRRGGSAESTEEVLALAAAGDAPAAEVVRSAGGALGSTVGLLVSVLDPEAVIVGGGVGSAGGPYWDAFVASTRAHVWSELHRGLPILPAAHGADAGVVGAAAAALASLGSVGSPLGR
ncbi:MAG: ROK family protein, partial [Planctomycetes bacterium]|nr:ROK family protein [Planctomycetota bacterium]